MAVHWEAEGNGSPYALFADASRIDPDFRLAAEAAKRNKGVPSGRKGAGAGSTSERLLALDAALAAHAEGAASAEEKWHAEMQSRYPASESLRHMARTMGTLRR